MLFHNVCGEAISLSDDCKRASRASECFCNGITFSSQPIKINQKICLELGHTTNWSGAIRIGVTTHNPDKFCLEDLPRYVCPDLTNKEGYWARSLNEKYAAAVASEKDDHFLVAMTLPVRDTGA